MLLVEDSVSSVLLQEEKCGRYCISIARCGLWCVEGRIWGEHSLVPRPHPPGNSGLVSMFAHE